MKKVLFFLALAALSGCNDNVTLDEACDGISPLCEKIQADSNCRQNREEVMVTAYHLQVADRKGKDQAMIDKMRYDQLMNLEEFAQCSYLQTLIEFVPPSQKFANAERHPDGTLTSESVEKMERYKRSIEKRKQAKDENYFYARRYQQSLNNITRDSNSPYLLYYHWSRNQNAEALDALKLHYDAGKIKAYDMLFYLSQAYGHYEPEVAKRMLIASLEVYPVDLYTSKNPPSDKKKYVPTLDDGERLHYPAMRALVQFYYSEKKYTMSYLYAKLLHLNKDRSAHIAMIREQLAKHVDTEQVDEVAETLHDALQDGEFSTSLIPQEITHG